MNIAHLLPASAHFPLTKHNGRYEWALRLAQAQALAGHTVTLYCGSGPTDVTSTIRWSGLAGSAVDKTARNLALFRSALQNHEHDIFHSHLDSLHYLVAAETTKPMVVTQHWFPNDTIAAAAKQGRNVNVTVVPVTAFMQQADTRLGIASSDVIYHGIDLELFKPTPEPRSDRLIFIGRITPQKGVREIVRLANQAGEKLDIVGKLNASDTEYWQSILPFVDGKNVRYLGPKPRSEVASLVASAKALVFAPQQPEAFGQVIIEAQACGTPVLLADTGAARELITPGKTGFLFTTQAEFDTAVADIGVVDAIDCRKFAEQFDERNMIARYSALYSRLVDGI